MNKEINYKGIIISDGDYSEESKIKLIKKCELLSYQDLFELLDEVEGMTIHTIISRAFNNKLNNETIMVNIDTSRERKQKQKRKVDSLNKKRNWKKYNIEGNR